jgi:hypothetical protein
MQLQVPHVVLQLVSTSPYDVTHNDRFPKESCILGKSEAAKLRCDDHHHLVLLPLLVASHSSLHGSGQQCMLYLMKGKARLIGVGRVGANIGVAMQKPKYLYVHRVRGHHLHHVRF